MALPQKVLEQLGREPPRTPGWAGQFLMFSGTLFFIAIFVYVGLVFGYRPYLVSEVRKLQDQINVFIEQIPAEEQGKIINFYSQLLNLRSLLSNHAVSSHFFGWVEDNTQANVYYDRFDLNLRTRELRLGGAGKSMEDLNQQFAIFSSRSEVERMNITSVAFSNNAWRFDMSLVFTPGYFRAGGAPPPPAETGGFLPESNR